MVQDAGAQPVDEQARLSDSRAQFVSSLGRRLEALRQALRALERTPRSAAHRDNLRRRVHAMGAAAGVLGFQRVFEAFRDVEQLLARTAQEGRVTVEDLAEVSRALDVVPSLVMGSPVAMGSQEPANRPVFEPSPSGWPLSVLLFGAAPLADALSRTDGAAGTPVLEFARTEDPEQAEHFVRMLAPDVAVIDSDRKGARELMEVLTHDPLLDPVQLVALGSFDRPEAAAALVALGVARVLPKPVSPETLRRTVVEVTRERRPPTARIDPVGTLTVEMLSERIAQEIRRGLVEATQPLGRSLPVEFGEGTDVLAAVWAAVARVRELSTMRSGGAVRFSSSGPEGAVPLAPWSSEERVRSGGGASRDASDVSLEGRRIVVVDDDPAVAWFLSNLLKAAGAEVFEAHDGEQALELTFDKWPELVISDILMPKVDGFALCRQIKRDVALSDLPVILLSWKEDLLQRVRELGAEADGYLKKEATASTVVSRVREVLRPRARVEKRIADGGEARGRLDGLTPRLVLETVCSQGLSARVNIRDAAFLYEVEVRRGRVKAASRTTPDGRSESGIRVLGPLLGARAGRFVVRRELGNCREEFDSELRPLLDPIIRRARAARRLLSAETLMTVRRVDVDEAAIAPYLEATPRQVRVVVARLESGAAPRDLLVSGHVGAEWLESVLADLVLHGGVRAVLDETGKDLLAEAFDAGAASPVVAASEVMTAPERVMPFLESPSARSTSVAVPRPDAKATPIAVPRPGPPKPVAPAALPVPEPEVEESPSEAGVVVAPPDRFVDVSSAPELHFELPPAEEAESLLGFEEAPAAVLHESPFDFTRETSPLERALSSSAFPDAEEHDEPEAPIAPADQAPELEIERVSPDPALLSLLSAEEEEEEARPQPDEGHADSEGKELDPTFEPVSSERPEDVVRPYFSKQAPPISAPREPSPFEAALRMLPTDELEGDRGEEPSEPEVVGKPVEPPRPRPRVMPPAVVLAEKASEGDFDLGAAVFSAVSAEEGAKAAEDRLTVRPEDRVTTQPPEPSSPPPEALPSPVPPATVEAADVADGLSAALAQSPSAEAVAMDVQHGILAPAKKIQFPRRADRPFSDTQRSIGSEIPDEPIPFRSPGTPSVKPRTPAPRTRAESPSLPTEDSGGAQRREVPLSRLAAGTASVVRKLRGPATTVGITVFAGVVSFAVVRAVRSGGDADPYPEPMAARSSPVGSALGAAPPAVAVAPREDPPTVASSEPVASADPAAPSGSTEENLAAPPPPSSAEKVRLWVESGRSLPPDLTVGPDKGLLDFDTEGPHVIYVDGVFVGRGPLRRVPLRPGEHDVRLVLDGEETAYRARIEPGKSTRVRRAQP